MKYKKLSILAAGVAAVATAIAPMASVNAWSPVHPTVVHEGDPLSYTITRKISDVSDTVNGVNFTYTITPDDNNPESGDSAVPTTASIAFTNVTPVEGVATATTTIDFSSAYYYKFGDYKYEIAETYSSDSGNYPVSSTKYYAYVSVRNHVDPTSGEIDGLVATLGGVEDSTGDKVEAGPTNNGVIFTSGTQRTYISFNKTVTGTAGDQEQCFDFEVTFEGNANSSYKVSTESDCNNPATASGDGTTTIRLKHGQSVTIGADNTTYQIPINATYSIAETGDNMNGYNVYIDGTLNNYAATGDKHTVAVGADTFTANNTTSFKNEKNADAHTGIVLSILPFVLIALAGIGGAFYVAKTKKVAE